MGLRILTGTAFGGFMMRSGKQNPLVAQSLHIKAKKKNKENLTGNAYCQEKAPPHKCVNVSKKKYSHKCIYSSVTISVLSQVYMA